MKKFVLLFLLYFIFQNFACSENYVFEENNKFGLKNSNSDIVVKPKYKKLVRLGKNAWIMQDGSKYGLIRDDGKIVIEPKYNQAERVLGQFVKFAKGDKYGIYDEMGFELLPVEYSSIDLLYGGFFVTCKNYKYGIADFNGQVILDNIFDDIYMPNFNKLVIVYGLQIIEIERLQGESLEIPYDVQNIRGDWDIKFSELSSSPLATAGYYGVTLADYVFKLISSISPAYEQTVDELMFSQGADTVSVLVKLSWLPKFPLVYAKKYYRNFINPQNGPLKPIKSTVKSKITK